METVKNEFNRRVIEINQYFDFLQKVENQQVKIHLPSGEVRLLETLLPATLKASGILLLYNLLESTVIMAIDYIHIAISTEDNLIYQDAIDEIKKIWIECRYNNFKNQDDGAEQLLKHMQDIINDRIVIFDSNDRKREYLNKLKGVNFSGKIDAQQIRKFAKKYGFEVNKRVEGKRLIQIKAKRNQLAHGELSFNDCGTIYTFSELMQFKKETVLFLKEFLLKVEKYLNHKKYKKL